jgi:hypothetical protein
MTDEPRDLDDARDERLAERLRVEPLDDLTRARLVRNAMAATSKWPARSRVLGIAAAVVLVLAVGFAVLARNDSGTTSTASRAPKPADELQAGRSDSWSSVSLGDLGDVGSTTMLRLAVRGNDAFAALGDASTSNGTANAFEALPTARESDAAARTVVTTCDLGAVARLGRTLAVGSGTVDGEPVTVYVVERADESRVAVVVGPDCRVRKPVPL